MRYLLTSVIFLLLHSTEVFAQKQVLIDSLQNAAVSSDLPDSLRAKAYNDLSAKLRSTDKERAFQYAEKALSLARKNSLKNTEALALKNIGNIYYGKSDYKSAYKYYRESLDIYRKSGNEKGEAVLIRNIGSVYHQQGLYSQALEHFRESLEMRRKIGDEKGIASLYNGIGLLYLEQGEDVLPKAQAYFEKSLAAYEKLENYGGIAQTYLRLGSVHGKQNRSDSALYYFSKFLELAQKFNNPHVSAQAHDALSSFYLQISKEELARPHIDSTIFLSKRIQNKFMLAGAYNNSGDYYTANGNAKRAVNEFKKSLEVLDSVKAPLLKKMSYEKLWKLYKTQGRTSEALEYLELYVQAKDSLQSKALTEAISQYEMQLDFNEMIKEKELNIQKRELEHSAQMNRQKIYTGSAVIALLLSLFAGAFIMRSLQLKKRSNKLLSEKNAHIIFQNEELQQKGEEIRQQNSEITRQHGEIMDSITYAKRIQEAVLPSESMLEELFEDYFVLFKPRDIVSGDFYWVKKLRNFTAFVAADCTGHGVPGAFMSMLGTSFLNELVTTRRMDNPGEILDRLRSKVKQSLKQTGSTGEQKDGMDLSFVIIDNESMELQFSGAYNSLFIIRNGEIHRLKADRQPVSVFIKERPFSTHTFQLQKGDAVYALSDGYPDQFGGAQGGKFKSKRFKKMLTEIYQFPMQKQKEELEKSFTDWRKGYEQVDDVLVFGVKV